MKIFFILILTILLIQSCISKKRETESVSANYIDTSKKRNTTLGIITTFSMDAANATGVIVTANQIYGQRFIANDTSFYRTKYTVDALLYPAQHPMIQGRDSIGMLSINFNLFSFNLKL